MLCGAGHTGDDRPEAPEVVSPARGGGFAGADGGGEVRQQPGLAILGRGGDFDWLFGEVFAPALAAGDGDLVLLEVDRSLGTLQPPSPVPSRLSAQGAPVAAVAEG